jgi:hypothetical protein
MSCYSDYGNGVFLNNENKKNFRKKQAEYNFLFIVPKKGKKFFLREEKHLPF